VIDSVLNFQFNSLLGVLLYWSPLAFCVVMYTVRTAKNHQRDAENRRGGSYYHPTDKARASRAS
jgi:hypothetical protein